MLEVAERESTIAFDSVGEYWGEAQVPYCYPKELQQRLVQALERNPNITTISTGTGWTGYSVFGRFNEVNFYALSQLPKDPYTPAERMTLQRLAPELPYWVWAALSAGAMTLLNCRGIRSTARANRILLAAMCLVVAAFVLLAVRFLFQSQGWGGLISTQPFYKPGVFDIRAVATVTSFAALTYIGFDLVTTLTEEVRNPKRDVLVATVGVCLFTGVLGTALVYLAQRVWPDFNTFPHPETAFMDVSRKVGGAFLFQGMAAVIAVSQFGSALTGQAGAARLLFGMGRDNVLARRIFGYADEKRSVPTVNVVLLGSAPLAGALAFGYEQAAELLNFRAFLAFLGVNLAALRRFYLATPAEHRSLFRDAVPPVLGFLLCLVIFLSLPRQAKSLGSIWLAGGLVYLAANTRGFRRQPATMDFAE